MSQHCNNEDGGGLSTARARHLERPDGAQGCALPRLVTTGENKSEGSPTFAGESPFQGERIELVTDGKRGVAVLHPLPLETAPVVAAHIDWLAFTMPHDSFPTESKDWRTKLNWLFPQLQVIFGISQMVHKPGRKFNGYENTFELLGRERNLLGILGIGGEHQRGTAHISLNGGGCALVPDWKKAADWGESVKAVLKRVDAAHDDFEGRTVNMENAVQWWQSGGFNSGGRTPGQDQRGDWVTPGSPAGRTFYVGQRGNAKYCRIYEKGKQLGDPSSPWVRVEVELKGNKAYRIPWDILTRSGQYLAGFYPCLNFLSAVQEKIRTITKAVTISYKRAVENAQQMVGKLVNVMMQVHGGDAFAVVNELKRDGVPGRLENYADFLPQIFDEGGNVALVN
jgi:phage replication initiation protein